MPTNALTQSTDWTKYYSGREFDNIEAEASRLTVFDQYLTKTKGRMFELGAGGSPFLARSAQHGWEVGGIDFNADALELIRKYLAEKAQTSPTLVVGDILTYDYSALTGRYDLLASFGLLEHFREPSLILGRWKDILRPGGRVLSAIPNLFSLNAKLLEKYDEPLWAQHIQYSPEDVDRFHVEAGLVPVEKARYTGKYDCHMLIPWEAMRQRFGSAILFKLTKYFAYYGVETLFRLLPQSNMKRVNPLIVGVYRLQGSA